MSRDHRGEDRRREDRRRHPSSRRGRQQPEDHPDDLVFSAFVFGWWPTLTHWFLENYHRIPFLPRLGRYGKTVGELEREKRVQRSRRPR